MIIKYTDREFTLKVTDDRGEPILAMRADNVEFEIDLTKTAISAQKLNSLIRDLIRDMVKGE